MGGGPLQKELFRVILNKASNSSLIIRMSGLMPTLVGALGGMARGTELRQYDLTLKLGDACTFKPECSPYWEGFCQTFCQHHQVRSRVSCRGLAHCVISARVLRESHSASFAYRRYGRGRDGGFLQINYCAGPLVIVKRGAQQWEAFTWD